MKLHDGSFSLEYVMVDGNPWFKGREAALMLKYPSTSQAVRIHVDDEDKNKVRKLAKNEMCLIRTPRKDRSGLEREKYHLYQ